MLNVTTVIIVYIVETISSHKLNTDITIIREKVIGMAFGEL